MSVAGLNVMTDQARTAPAARPRRAGSCRSTAARSSVAELQGGSSADRRWFSAGGGLHPALPTCDNRTRARKMKTRSAILLWAALAAPLSAQIEGDPRAKIQEILDEVAGEMEQIDQWLLEGSRTKDAARGIAANGKRIDELLEIVGKSQERVVQGIDELLKEADKLKGKGDGC